MVAVLYYIFPLLFSLQQLQTNLNNHPIGYNLLPEKFTLTEIQSLYEVILNKKMDTRNFRKKLAKMKLLWKNLENVSFNPTDFSHLK